jgi:hypothetical protein
VKSAALLAFPGSVFLLTLEKGHDRSMTVLSANIQQGIPDSPGSAGCTISFCEVRHFHYLVASGQPEYGIC